VIFLYLFFSTCPALAKPDVASIVSGFDVLPTHPTSQNISQGAHDLFG
jgi:hypothetical protein